MGTSSGFAIAFSQNGLLHVPCPANGGAVTLQCQPFRVLISCAREPAIIAVHASVDDTAYGQVASGAPLDSIRAFDLSRQFDAEAEAEISMVTAWFEEDAPSVGLIVDDSSHQCWWMERGQAPMSEPLMRDVRYVRYCTGLRPAEMPNEWLEVCELSKPFPRGLGPPPIVGRFTEAELGPFSSRRKPVPLLPHHDGELATSSIYLVFVQQWATVNSVNQSATRRELCRLTVRIDWDFHHSL